jgi:hypothetical protein
MIKPCDRNVNKTCKNVMIREAKRNESGLVEAKGYRTERASKYDREP